MEAQVAELRGSITTNQQLDEGIEICEERLRELKVENENLKEELSIQKELNHKLNVQKWEVELYDELIVEVA